MKKKKRAQARLRRRVKDLEEWVGKLKTTFETTTLRRGGVMSAPLFDSNAAPVQQGVDRRQSAAVLGALQNQEIQGKELKMQEGEIAELKAIVAELKAAHDAGLQRKADAAAEEKHQHEAWLAEAPEREKRDQAERATRLERQQREQKADDELAAALARASEVTAKLRAAQNGQPPAPPALTIPVFAEPAATAP